MSDDDGLVAHQDPLDDKADGPRMLLDVEGLSRGPLPIQETREGLCPLADRPISSETSNGRAVVHARRRLLDLRVGRRKPRSLQWGKSKRKALTPFWCRSEFNRHSVEPVGEIGHCHR